MHRAAEPSSPASPAPRRTHVSTANQVACVQFDVAAARRQQCAARRNPPHFFPGRWHSPYSSLVTGTATSKSSVAVKKTLCANCGKAAHTREEVCPKTDSPICINCKGAHLPYDRSCPELIFQRKIRSLGATHNSSVQDASIILRSTTVSCAPIQLWRKRQLSFVCNSTANPTAELHHQSPPPISFAFPHSLTATTGNTASLSHSIPISYASKARSSSTHTSPPTSPQHPHPSRLSLSYNFSPTPQSNNNNHHPIHSSNSIPHRKTTPHISPPPPPKSQTPPPTHPQTILTPRSLTHPHLPILLNYRSCSR